MGMKRRIIEAAICVVFVVVVLCGSSVNAQNTASSQENASIAAQTE